MAGESNAGVAYLRAKESRRAVAASPLGKPARPAGGLRWQRQSG
ncbi:hypothetical protein [Micromonospora sp. WMMD1082]|nr:hypothetical protein [Micromonospora sp. WMMD1082]MDG4795214.1 hypothetical protein [Micromonospora sp. WMMD1082]